MLQTDKALKDFRMDVREAYRNCSNKSSFNSKKFRKMDEGKIAYLTMNAIMEMQADPKKMQLAINLHEDVNQEFENLKRDVLDGEKEVEIEIKAENVAKLDDIVDEEIENMKKNEENNLKDEQEQEKNESEEENSKDEEEQEKNESFNFLKYIREEQDKEESEEIDEENHSKNQDDEIKFEDDDEENISESNSNIKFEDEKECDEEEQEKNESFNVASLFGQFLFENEKECDEEEEKDECDAGVNKIDKSELTEEDDVDESTGEIPAGLPYKRVISQKRKNEEEECEEEEEKDECDAGIDKINSVTEMARLVSRFIKEQEQEKCEEEEDKECDEEEQEKNVQESFIRFYKENVGLNHPVLSKNIKEGLQARCEAIRESFIDAAKEAGVFKTLNESEGTSLIKVTGGLVRNFLQEAVSVLSTDTNKLVDSYIVEEVYPALSEQVNSYITEEVQPELFKKFNSYMEYVAEEITNDLNNKKLIVASNKAKVQESFINKLLEAIKDELKVVPEQEDALEIEQEKAQMYKESLSEERIEKARINQRNLKLQKENWILRNLPSNVSESRREQIENMTSSLDESLSIDEFIEKSKMIIKEGVKENRKTLDKIIKEEFIEKPSRPKRHESFDDFLAESINRL